MSSRYAFWGGVKRGCVYGMAASVAGLAVTAVYVAPAFLALTLVATLAFGWMAYEQGRDDETDRLLGMIEQVQTQRTDAPAGEGVRETMATEISDARMDVNTAINHLVQLAQELEEAKQQVRTKGMAFDRQRAAVGAAITALEDAHERAWQVNNMAAVDAPTRAAESEGASEP